MSKFRQTEREEVNNSNFMSLDEVKKAKAEKREQEFREKYSKALSYEDSVKVIQNAITKYLNNTDDFYNFEFLYWDNGKKLESVYVLDSKAQKEAEEKGYEFQAGLPGSIDGLKIIFD